MQDHIGIDQLLSTIGLKQLLLDRANEKIASLERFVREHMEKEHPEPAPELPQVGEDA